ncbi:MAG: CopG family ribbon-helix-helix protein [Acidilobaceae archaeon]
MTIISISIPDVLVEKIDEAIGILGYTSRSEFIREAIRKRVEEAEVLRSDAKSIFIIMALSDHSKYKASDAKILEIIHSYQPDIKAFYHLIIRDFLCLNIAIIESFSNIAFNLVRELRSVRGVIDIQVYRLRYP